MKKLIVAVLLIAAVLGMTMTPAMADAPPGESGGGQGTEGQVGQGQQGDGQDQPPGQFPPGNPKLKVP